MAAPTISTGNSAEKPINDSKKPLPFPLNLYQTAVGKKWVMAITGLMLLGFVLTHMIGNLKLYIGIVTHNDMREYDADVYGEFLRELLVPILPRGYFLWLLRGGLVAAFALHIHSAYSLTRMNLKSNRAYESKRDFLAANFASRSMRYTGTIVGLYIIFHLADLTWGVNLGYEWERGAVQANVVGSFSNPVIAATYIVANIALAIHIFHGTYSMFQSLGINNPRYNNLRKGIAKGFAGLILIGNISFPIAVLSGVIEHNECPAGVSASEDNNCVDAEHGAEEA